MSCLRRLLPAALLLAAAAPASAQTAASWEIRIFHPFRPGVMQQCRNAHLLDGFERDSKPDQADPLKAWLLQGPFTVQWSGGTFSKPAPESPAAVRDRGIVMSLGECFTLMVDGKPVLSGAALMEYSARALDFPTLTQLAPDASNAGGARQFTLSPVFPASHGALAPPDWHRFLPR